MSVLFSSSIRFPIILKISYYIAFDSINLVAFYSNHVSDENGDINGCNREGY